ncbi:MAG TPA: GMC family oxidoreductase [Caulobacteraceae bacterium]
MTALDAEGSRSSGPGGGRQRDHWDVVVVGSGAGGATIAHRLAGRGARVLVVEAGDFLKPAPLSPGQPIGRFMYDVIGGPGGTMSFVGGKTKFYGGALYRMRLSDFEQTEADGARSWPIGYGDLEPYYDQAERLYHVHGAAVGDPSEPPRASPYPYPPLPHAPLVARMVERLERAGTPTSPIPRALDYGPGGKCVLCATCDSYMCELEAKMDAEIAALRPALSTGQVTLATHTQCLRIETTANGQRVRAVVLGDAGGVRTVTAGCVVAAAGIYDTARLLRRSRTDQHPQGLGGDGGALGRYLGGHSAGYVFALMSLGRLPPMHSKTFAINAFHEGAPDWPHRLGVIQAVGQIPFWKTASGPMKGIARMVGERSMTFFYSVEAPPSRGSGLLFEGDEVAATAPPVHDMAAFERMRRLAAGVFRRAGYQVLARRRAPYLWHETGTARMGADPATSVADSDCQVHGVKGLYVADQSVMATAGCVNTSLTVMALALRAGDHIAGARAPGSSTRVDRRKAAPPPEELGVGV